MISCKGNGECLQLNEYTSEYYKVNYYSCKHNCIPVHCPNYIICGSKFPKHILNYYNGVCYYCNEMFGKKRGGTGILKAIENKECPICLETTRCIIQPKCDHYICVECFQNCYYGDYNDNIPKFPYSEEYEQSYYLDYNNPLWKNDPKIKKWLKELEILNKKKIDNQKNKDYLKLCPICRK